MHVAKAQVVPLRHQALRSVPALSRRGGVVMYRNVSSEDLQPEEVLAIVIDGSQAELPLELCQGQSADGPA